MAALRRILRCHRSDHLDRGRRADLSGSAAPDPRDALPGLLDDARRRLAGLDDELDGLRRDRAAESADDEHDPDGSTLSGEWSRLEGLRTHAAREVEEVEAALLRVDAGTYGVCVRCGRDIPPVRLDARPTAITCVACAG